jgi:hypothetical protein
MGATGPCSTRPSVQRTLSELHGNVTGGDLDP